MLSNLKSDVNMIQINESIYEFIYDLLSLVKINKFNFTLPFLIFTYKIQDNYVYLLIVKLDMSVQKWKLITII